MPRRNSSLRLRVPEPGSRTRKGLARSTCPEMVPSSSRNSGVLGVTITMRSEKKGVQTHPAFCTGEPMIPISAPFSKMRWATWLLSP